ncbi:MAG: sensor histidine kinase [Aliihoeflea sp.]
MTESSVRVLHVDDDLALARLLERALGRRGFVLENVADIEIAAARIEAGEVDVVVLDHYLAGQTGLELLERLGQTPAPPPVVYVTGSSDANIAIDALKAGAADYVLKTVGEEFVMLLASAIEQSLHKSRLQRAKEQAEAEVRAARDRAELLLTEVNHRVANSLALVAALVRMQAGSIKDPGAKDALAETEARISAIAGLHRKLYTSSDVRSVALDEYLSALVAELDNSMRAAGHRSRTRLCLERVDVSPDKAVSIGMIVTELLTNAYKYAYPDGREGEVRVIVRRETHTEAELVVEDDGVGWSGDGKPQGTGLGTRIVRSMAVNLGTEIVYRSDRPGTVISLRLTVDELGLNA